MSTPGGTSAAVGPASEKIATPSGPVSGSAAGSVLKLRSCVVCRSRKVRCDKLSPCSNCRRANIACVFPSNDRPPRWARRLERATSSGAPTGIAPQAANPGVGQVMERLRTLEGLVKELGSQLEQAHAVTRSSPSAINSPSSSANDQDTEHEQSNVKPAGVQQQFGRLVLQDANRSRYISSGFWSRINDEVWCL
jgi:hypothetical protein